MSALNLQNVVMHYGDFQAVRDVSVDIKSGEFVVVVGPSGCGKSSLLRAVAGLERISSGAIVLDGNPIQHVPPSKRELAMVFQNYALYPQKTVAQNMGFALLMAKYPKDEIKSRVEQAARVLKIHDLLERKPGELSGGQRQRVAIGRAIVREPKVFLFDEPLSNLDAALRVDMRVELSRLHQSLAATMIYVTHDQVEAMTLADRVVVLNGGKIAQVGKPLTLYREPRNLFVAGFIGSPKMNLFPATLIIENHHAMVKLNGGNLKIKLSDIQGRLKNGESVTVGIRPEHLKPVSPATDISLSLVVTLIEELGEEMLLYGDMDNRPIVVKLSEPMQVEPGTTINVTVSDEKIHLFDSNGVNLRYR